MMKKVMVIFIGIMALGLLLSVEDVSCWRRRRRRRTKQANNSTEKVGEERKRDQLMFARFVDQVEEHQRQQDINAEKRDPIKEDEQLFDALFEKVGKDLKYLEEQNVEKDEDADSNSMMAADSAKEEIYDEN